MSNQLGVLPGGVELATSPVGTGGSGGSPTGPAGGDLTGTFPNPQIAAGAVTTAKLANGAVTGVKIATGAVGPTQLADTAVTPGSYTNTNLTVDADGRITAAASGSSAPTGAAGGSLAGTYPNPSIATGAVGPTELANTAVTPGSYTNTSLTVDADGRLTAAASGGPVPMVLLDSQTLSGATTITTASWTANLYERIIIDVQGLLGAGLLSVRMNADAGTKYADQYHLITGAGSDATDFFGTPTSVTVANANLPGGTFGDMAAKIEILPLKLGFKRVGFMKSATYSSAFTIFSCTTIDGTFCWNDTATDLTFATLIASVSFSGKIRVYGVLA